MRFIKRWRWSFAVLALAITLNACSENKPDDDAAARRDEAAASESLSRYQDAQPVPVFDWSQIRQNLIEIQVAQAQTTATTSFFFNQGTDAPIGICPSIGFPIPTTAQLTNPDQVVQDGPRERGSVTLPQMEQTGIFTGDSTGTYVMCVNDAGDPYAFYWEGFVSTVSGQAQFIDGQIELIGQPTGEFTTGEG